MFKISTKGDYGLLLLSAIAQAMNEGRQFTSLKEIAQARKLSLSYLSQIVISLKDAGLVESKEGRDGGYRLARAPQEITVMQVLEALEGPLEPVRCCSNKAGKCGSESYCGVKTTWRSAQTMLTEFLKSKTLAETLNPKPES